MTRLFLVGCQAAEVTWAVGCEGMLMFSAGSPSSVYTVT